MFLNQKKKLITRFNIIYKREFKRINSLLYINSKYCIYVDFEHFYGELKAINPNALISKQKILSNNLLNLGVKYNLTYPK